MISYRFLIPLALSSCLALYGCIPKASVPAPPADTTAPTLAQVTAVPNGNDTTPNYTFSSSEAGTITYGGSCSSATTSAISGSNSITLSTLGYGVYSNCTVRVTDAAGNASSVLAVNSFSVVRPKPINDTGITKCGDMAYSYSGYTGSGTHNNDVVCATAGSTTTTAGTDSNGDAVPAGQDAVFGRDANPATNNDTDGHKGFSFTKLSAVDGSVLAIQNGTWSDSGSESAGTKWGCVQDNVTGLVWEVKTNDGGLRDKDWTYSWYNTDSTNNGGNAGTPDVGDNCYSSTRCDTEKYVVDVNAATLCGFSDWRLPIKQELQTIVANDRVAPAVDVSFIPNTISNYYWSSSLYNSNPIAFVVYFYSGSEFVLNKENNYYVRLVRGD